MVKILRSSDGSDIEFFNRIRSRGESTDRKVTAIVGDIISDVRENGDSAVKKYTSQFDCAEPACYCVPDEWLDDALNKCDKEFLSSLEKAAENIRAFHKNQLSHGFEMKDENGSLLGQIVRALECVGIYVPGGTAAYPSSVLMNAIPAKIAGVEKIIMVTPPPKDGSLNYDILAAAKIAGVDEVFLCGGAQAVAALAFGTDEIQKADKIVGPGNIFVATAKKLLFGVVDIDMIAGPSEILIVADKSANAKYLAADMMSQAEHDRLASAILITTDEKLANDTLSELERQSAALSRKDIIDEALENYGAIIVCDDVDYALGLADKFAPEHLELCVKDPMAALKKIKNAGSVFLGNNSPEPLGDYFAGPNHVLPTSGTARFFSPLSVDEFIKKMQYINYSEQSLKAAADDVIRLANAEGLTAHANSIIVRKDG